MLFIFIAILTLGLFHVNDAHIRVSDDHVDYLTFRQIWPEPTCMFPGKHSCKIAKNVSTWVVHGLWPSQRGEFGPFFCNKSLPFDYKKLQPLVGKLLKYWPNLYTDTEMDSFWAHEWEKHGTCALTIGNVTNELTYFNLSLNMRDLFDFGPMLEASKIVPDDTNLYNLDDIVNAIQSKLGVHPMPVCYVQRDSDVQYLSQMQICFSKSFAVMDCPKDAVELINISIDNTPQEIACLDNKPVLYPTIKPKFSKLSKIVMPKINYN